ncbi:MAG: LPP20 family lipoprotein [Treponema sp.]|jgi:hypothetical protein|nr:LPP20 family lipoprotein [Treponema sp.]
MKKIVVALLVFVCIFMVTGCASGPKSDNVQKETVAQAADAPSWYLKPPKSEDAIYGRGVAKMADLNMSQRMAENRATVAIALTLNANVQSMITDFTQSAGNAGSEQTLNFQQSVSRTTTDAKLSGLEVEDVHVGKDGSYYVLMSMSKADAARQAAAILDNEVAKYSEFKAMEALKMMDAQLKKDNVDAALVDK